MRIAGMRMQLVFLLLGVVLISGEVDGQVVLKGSVRDAVSRDYLEGVHVFVEGGTEKVKYTNKKGVFSIRIAEFPCLLSLSSVGYHRKDLLISANPGFVLELELIPETMEINEVAITAGKYLQYLKEEVFYVKDFTFHDRLIWVTGYPQKNVNRPEIRVISLAGKTLAKLPTGRRPELFGDALGNVHLVEADSVFQLYYTEEIMKLYGINKGKAFSDLLRIQYLDKERAVLKKVSGAGNLNQYSNYFFSDSSTHVLHQSYDRKLFSHSQAADKYTHGEIPNTGGTPGPSIMTVQLASIRDLDPQFALMSDEQLTQWIQNTEGKPPSMGASWISPTDAFTNYAMDRLLTYKPIVSRYFQVDSLEIIFEDRERLVWVYENGGPTPEFYHIELPAKATDLDMIQDKLTKSLFVTYGINGRYHVAQIDPSNGAVLKTKDLSGFAFVENIQAYNGRIYFTHFSHIGRRTMNLFSMVF